ADAGAGVADAAGPPAGAPQEAAAASAAAGAGRALGAADDAAPPPAPTAGSIRASRPSVSCSARAAWPARPPERDGVPSCGLVTARVTVPSDTSVTWAFWLTSTHVARRSERSVESTAGQRRRTVSASRPAPAAPRGAPDDGAGPGSGGGTLGPGCGVG